MKGDKGIEQSHLNLQQVEKALLSYQRPHPEFAGTLLGFDDYVSMFCPFTLLPRPLTNLPHRYGARGRDRVVRFLRCHIADFN